MEIVGTETIVTETVAAAPVDEGPTATLAAPDIIRFPDPGFRRGASTCLSTDHLSMVKWLSMAGLYRETHIYFPEIKGSS